MTDAELDELLAGEPSYPALVALPGLLGELRAARAEVKRLREMGLALLDELHPYLLSDEILSIPNDDQKEYARLRTERRQAAKAALARRKAELEAS